jgi:hypothetical protein
MIDLDDVLFEETRRGRRPIDIAEWRKKARLKEDFRKLLERATEEEFRDAMRALGMRDGSEQMEAALRVWRDYRGSWPQRP